MSSQAERTEQATPRRLQQAREKGDFPTSRETVAAVQFLTFVMVLGAWGPAWFASTKYWLTVLLQQAFRAETTPRRLLQIFGFIAKEALLPLAVAGAVILLAAVGTHLVISGFGWSPKRLGSGLSNFSPFSKLGEIRKQALPALLQGALLLAGSGFALYWIANENIDKLYTLPFMGIRLGTEVAFHSISDLLWKATIIFGIFGGWELLRQKKKFLEKLKMTKQEIREEVKESEGNPQVKFRIRRLQRDMGRRRMMSDVPKASVVVVNPTHYAVAIRYDHDTMACPVVVAKGKNYLALRIRSLAVEHGVPLVENPPLAQSLYKTAEVGQEIPPALYRAMAEVLAYVYELASRMARR